LDIKEMEGGWQELSFNAIKKEFCPCEEAKSGSASIMAKQRGA
jgi:hypothetical protein